MLKVDPALRQISVRPTEVLVLLESMNQPLVNIPSIGTSQTRAYILGRRVDASDHRIYVFLLQEETGAFLVYVSDPERLSVAAYRQEEEEALRFVASMGFEMSDYGFARLTREGQAAVMSQVPIFSAEITSDMPTLELLDVAEDPVVLDAPAPLETSASLFGGFDPAQQAAFRQAGVLPDHAASGMFDEVSNIPGEPGLVALGVPRASEPTEASELAQDAYTRLGRFLSTFLLLGAIAAACAHSVGQGEELPAHLETKRELAMGELGEGRWAEGIKRLTEVVEEAPYDAESLHALAVAHLQLGRPVEAESYLKRTLSAQPKHSIAKNTYASLLIQSERCEEARPLLEDALADIHYPTPEFAEHNMARAEVCLGESEKAMNRLERLLARRPQFCLGYLTLAELTSQAKKAEATIDACEHFRANCELHEKVKEFVSPEHACLCYLKKGLAYAELGDSESARESFMSCRSDGEYGRQCRRSLDLLPEP